VTDWYREALQRIEDWPNGYDEIILPEIDAFLHDVLEADDPEPIVKGWRAYVADYRRDRAPARQKSVV